MARRWGRATGLGAAAVVLAAVGLDACGDEAATTCVDHAGARFCVTRQGKTAVESTATGLEPGSDYTVVLTGEGVPDDPGRVPTVMQVSADGSAGLTTGVFGVTSPGVPDGTEVVFTAISADGTPVIATVVVGS